MINVQYKTTVSGTGSRPSRPVNKRKRKELVQVDSMESENDDEGDHKGDEDEGAE